VHLIDDLRGVRNIPPVSTIFNMQFLRHPRLGSYVTLGVLYHPVLRFIARRVSGLVGVRYADTRVLEDAYGFILARDPKLPPLETWVLPPEVLEQ
jgi:hypothetical protein